jgi:hypothetical protein
MKETPKLYTSPTGGPAVHEHLLLRRAWPLLQVVKKLEAHLLDHERKHLNDLAKQVLENNRLDNTGVAIRWCEHTLAAIEARRVKAEKIASQKKALPNA